MKSRGGPIVHFVCTLFLFVLFSGYLSTVAAAAQPEAGPDTKKVVKDREAGSAGFPVTFRGENLFFVKTGRKGMSPEQRAAAISERIRRLANEHSVKPDEIVVEDMDDSSMIIGGDIVVMGVYAGDSAMEGMEYRELAEAHARTIREALSLYRSSYGTRNLLIGAGLAVFSIIIALGLLWLLARGALYARNMIETRYAAKIKGLHIQSLEIIQADRIKILILGLVKVVRIVLSLIVIYACLHSLFAFFPWTRGFAAGLFSYVLIPIKAVGSGMVRAVPNLIVLAVIVIIARYILKVLHLIFLSVEKGTVIFPGFDVEWAQLTYKIIRFLFVAFVTIIAFPYIPGADTPIFKGVSIFIGVLFSLGSQSAISNIIAGMALTYRRAFRVGDRIMVNEVTGDVVELKLQTTRIRTVKNESVIVPNGLILNSNVVNYTALAREKGLILYTKVTIGYDTPWRQVHALLLMAAGKTTGLLGDPPPFILQRSLDDFYITYELNVYTDAPDRMMQIYSDLHQNIQDAFNEYGVQIMSPHFIGDKAAPTYVPREHWFDPPARE